MKIKAQSFFSRFSQGGFLTGSALLFASTMIVNAGNYVFNLILGRWLGPAAYADLSLIVTLNLVLTFITLTFQTTVAKFVAMHTAAGALDLVVGLRRWLGRIAWVLGTVLLLFFVLGAPLLQRFFHTASAWPFVLFGIGLPMFFAMGVDRGVLQGQIRFGLLALSNQAEMWVRLIVGVGLVALGLWVNGAVAGLMLSYVATWLVARQAKAGLPESGQMLPGESKQILFYAGPVIGALAGQVLINNSDVLAVKRFFSPELAGQYAALALIGRIVYFATWSIVTAMFPIVAQKHQRGEPHRYLLWLSLGLVGSVSTGIVIATIIMPELIVRILFGEQYVAVASLLWLYALSTAVYTLANVVISYRLSLGNGAGSYLAVVAGLVQLGALWVFNTSLLAVVLVKLYVMIPLLVILLAWDMRLVFVGERTPGAKVST